MKLTSDVVKKISSIKGEPKWMLDFRLTSLDAFNKSSNPNFGPKLDINYDSINYYKESKKISKDIEEEIFSNIKLLEEQIINCASHIR